MASTDRDSVKPYAGKSASARTHAAQVAPHLVAGQTKTSIAGREPARQSPQAIAPRTEE